MIDLAAAMVVIVCLVILAPLILYLGLAAATCAAAIAAIWGIVWVSAHFLGLLPPNILEAGAWVIGIAVCLLLIVALWELFEKVWPYGSPGRAALMIIATAGGFVGLLVLVFGPGEGAALTIGAVFGCWITGGIIYRICQIIDEIRTVRRERVAEITAAE